MKVALIGGFYVAKSLIANAQRCCNLYPEKNQEDAPFPFTTYLTPGLTLLSVLPTAPVRGLWTTGAGALFAVGGNVLYSISSAWAATVVGTIGTTTGPVSMSDNRLVLILVDGTLAINGTPGWYADLTAANTFGPITAAAFYGADKVDEVDTFFCFNQPATANFYLSTSEINAALITGGSVATGTIAGGMSYNNGVHAAVPLTGSATGAGATADITVVANAVTVVSINAGTESAPYEVGDVLTASAGSPGGLGGGLTGVSAIGGVGYTPGTYTGVALSGGSGSLAVATIVVGASGAVTTVTPTTYGQDYVVGDQLTVAASLIGGTGTGFAATVTSVNTAGSGFSYTVTAVNAGSLAFDPLDIAAKSGSSDLLATLVAIHREIHLIGEKTSEPWYNAGAPDFAFQAIQGVFYEHGCIAKYSVAKADLAVFWLGQDKQGKCIVFREEGYVVKRASTHAIENVFQSYPTVSDAIGFFHQTEGHVFYVLTFPTADATWVCDLATEMWHEWVWTDTQGGEHRSRANCQAFAYGVNVVGDWENGNLYMLDMANQTDNGAPIVRRRSFPHLVNEGKRLSYDRFICEMEVGNDPDTTDSDVAYALTIDSGGDALTVDSEGDALLIYSSRIDNPGPTVSLRYSDTKGKTFGNPVQISLGAQGEFGRSIQTRQLGMGRDRVFELFWSNATVTALNGAYIDATEAET